MNAEELQEALEKEQEKLQERLANLYKQKRAVIERTRLLAMQRAELENAFGDAAVKLREADRLLVLLKKMKPEPKAETTKERPLERSLR